MLIFYWIAYLQFSIALHAVLASKGIDPALVDKRVERKASVTRLTGKVLQGLIWFSVLHHDLFSSTHYVPFLIHLCIL